MAATAAAPNVAYLTHATLLGHGGVIALLSLWHESTVPQHVRYDELVLLLKCIFLHIHVFPILSFCHSYSAPIIREAAPQPPQLLLLVVSQVAMELNQNRYKGTECVNQSLKA